MVNVVSFEVIKLYFFADFTLNLKYLNQFIDNEQTIDSLQQHFTELKNLFSAKRVALELITNLTAPEDTDEESMDLEDGMDVDDDDDEQDVDPNSSVIDSDHRLSPELERLLAESSMLVKIGQHLSPVDQQLGQTLANNKLGVEILDRYWNRLTQLSCCC